jgi:hypothetical protein
VFEVLRRPDHDEQKQTDIEAIEPQNLPDKQRYLKPTNVKTALELVRQMMVFAEQHVGLDITLLEDNTILITLNQVFGARFYIKVGTETQKLLGLRKYLYYFKYDNPAYVGNNVEFFIAVNDQPDPDTSVSLFVVGAAGAPDKFFVFQGSEEFDPPGPADDPDESDDPGDGFDLEYTYKTDNPVGCLDTRLSLDVEASLPISTQPRILNGVETHDYLLGRFPIRDYIDRHVSYTDQDEYSVTETVNLGLEDLCRKNPNTITNYCLPGEIVIINIKIVTRYLENKKIKTVDTDYSNGGYWSLKLLFSKKQK